MNRQGYQQVDIDFNNFEPTFSMDDRIDRFNAGTKKIHDAYVSMNDLDFNNPEWFVDCPDKYRLIARRRLGYSHYGGESLRLFLISVLFVADRERPDSIETLCSRNITFTSIFSGIPLSLINGVSRFKSFSGKMVSNYCHELIVPIDDIAGWNE